MKKLKNLSLAEHYAIHCATLFFGGIIALIGIQFTPEINVGTIIGVILIITSLVWRFLFVKCPHCHCQFNLRAPLPTFCPNCGERIK